MLGVETGEDRGIFLSLLDFQYFPLVLTPHKQHLFSSIFFLYLGSSFLLSLPQRESFSDSCIGTKEKREDPKS